MINSFRISDISEIDYMDGHIFEDFCAEILKRNGFLNVYVTKGSGDQGVDILASKDGIKYAVQCKNYSTHLGNTPIQEAYAGKTHYNCHVAVVMTNSKFTQGAKELAESTGVLLWDREKLSDMINKANILYAKNSCAEKKTATENNADVQKEKLNIKHISVKTVSKDEHVKSNKPQSKLRKSMKIWSGVCSVFALVYIWAALITGEYMVSSMTVFFGILSVMFLLLAMTPKEQQFLLNTNFKKSTFVTICVIVAFVLCGTIILLTENNL